MNKLALFVLGAVGAVTFALTSKGSGASDTRTLDQKITGIPRTNRLAFRLPVPNENVSNALRIGPAIVTLDGKSLPPSWSNNRAPLESYRAVAREFQNASVARKKMLPPDAKPNETDQYSKELYWAPSWLTLIRWQDLSESDLKQAVNGSPFDEFGRLMPGVYGGGPQNLWDQTLGGLLKNPLFKTVALGALVASGPQGMAVYGAYTMWQARGEKLSPTNALLIAGRSYAVSQCGPACGVAFDFGVGVASGKSADKAAEDALYKEMNPAQQDAFKRGKQLVRGMS